MKNNFHSLSVLPHRLLSTLKSNSDMKISHHYFRFFFISFIHSLFSSLWQFREFFSSCLLLCTHFFAAFCVDAWMWENFYLKHFPSIFHPSFFFLAYLASSSRVSVQACEWVDETRRRRERNFFDMIIVSSYLKGEKWQITLLFNPGNMISPDSFLSARPLSRHDFGSSFFCCSPETSGSIFFLARAATRFFLLFCVPAACFAYTHYISLSSPFGYSTYTPENNDFPPIRL